MTQWIEFEPDQVVAKMDFPLLGREIRISAVWVDSQTSKQLLKMNVHNRNLSRKQIDQIKRDIASDKWAFTGDAIRVSDEGVLIDGQHRLVGVDQVGARVPMLIIEGLDPQASGWIDQNRRRSVPDILRFRDITVSNVTTCAGAASILMQADLSTPATREMVADYVEEHSEELQRVAQWAKNMCNESPMARSKTRINSRALSPGPLTALVIYMLRQGANAKLLEEFIEGVATGLSRTEEDKVTYAAMRKRIESVPLFTGSGGAQYPVLLTEGFAVFIQAYNRWADGHVLKMIRSANKETRQLIRTYDKLPKVNNRQSRPGTISLIADDTSLLVG